jgi:hypothetical protein
MERDDATPAGTRVRLRNVALRRWGRRTTRLRTGRSKRYCQFDSADASLPRRGGNGVAVCLVLGPEYAPHPFLLRSEANN